MFLKPPTVRFVRNFISAIALTSMVWAAGGRAPLHAAEIPPAATRTVDFVKDIRPIFEKHCYSCHDEKKQKGGLRFDQKESLARGGDSGEPAFVAGKSAESLLIKFVAGVNPDEIMPPKGDPLTASEVGLLRAWIDQGANWPEQASTPVKKHWAYVKPESPTLPPVKNQKWARNGIDRFILAKLESEKLKPSPEATKEQLIRRVTLDLIGVPPTLEEVEAFLQDTKPGAFERVVDRLLHSPHYGERWARPWLDLARYADTNGYEADMRRSMWPYRDWVINALNRNISFEEFTIEQIAGDMLPNATLDQRVATAFHRNTMNNTEGGTDNEEFRHEAIVDRINTTFSVWMGTTMACAQCHNHKYDPISMKEYYQAYALLNNTADADTDDMQPVISVPTDEQSARMHKLRLEIAEWDKLYQKRTPEFDRAMIAWQEETKAKLTNWNRLPVASVAAANGTTLTIKEDQSILASGENPASEVYTVKLTPGLTRITGLRLEVLPDDSLPTKSSGRHASGNFILTRWKASLENADGSTTPLTFNTAEADVTQEGHNITNLFAAEGNKGWAPAAHEPANRKELSAYFYLVAPLDVPTDAKLVVTLEQQSEYAGANLGKFRLSATSQESPTAAPRIATDVREAILIGIDAQNDKQKRDVAAHYRTIAPPLENVRNKLGELRKEESDLDREIGRVAVMEELPFSRQTHMLIRGGFLSKGDAVDTGFPSTFNPGPKDQPWNRLAFARWLVDTNNPLTARVIMNRFWEQYFGIGILETSEDFGLQGDLPSHPELLDWLATEFMRSKWDMKSMHRLIVTSATYRQSSRVTPELLERDPYNRWLARGPRFRLPAEAIRDQYLAVSGLLSEKIGGPSVMPPQPAGLWQVVYNGDNWETSKGEDKYRRGLYTFWRRSLPHPVMTTFDAPSREFCVIKRSRSNTPLQALALMNDPAAIEAAQALARRIVNEGGKTTVERIEYAYQLCLSRKPTKAEVRRLTEYYDTEWQNFRKDLPAALRMATSELGDPKHNESAVDLAAWTIVANVLLNLDEMVTKG